MDSKNNPVKSEGLYILSESPCRAVGVWLLLSGRQPFFLFSLSVLFFSSLPLEGLAARRKLL